MGKIKGIVRQNPVALERCAMFAVEDGDNTYLVISTDRQASKDNIFVAKGQEIAIKGSLIEDVGLKGVILTKQAQITIKKDEQEQEN